MRNFILILVIGTALASCKSTSKAPSEIDKPTFPIIIFGQGGGFTGATERYSLNQRGELAKISVSDTIILSTLDETMTNKVFSKLDSICLENKAFDEPGNMTYFLEKNTQDGKNNSFKWGSVSFNTPKSISSLHQDLMKLVYKAKKP